jgi:hypothetical protein
LELAFKDLKAFKVHPMALRERKVLKAHRDFKAFRD